MKSLSRQAGNDERFSDICEYGLKGAKSLADKVDYCLAVSEFNKKDLLNMGYKCPIDVLPIIIPMSDYDKAPDKSVVKKYSDDYVNILFTGRIAPNKKQENLMHKPRSKAMRHIFLKSDT